MINHFRNLLILLLLVGCISKSSAQLDKKKVINGAKNLCESLIKQNWDEYKKYSPPKLFELMGGLEKSKNYITAQWNEGNEKGIRLKKVIIDSCTKISKYKNEYQASLRISFEYQTDSTIIMTRSTIIAFTNDNGLNWFYLDTYNLPINQIYSYFPNINKDLTIFKKGEPVVTKKNKTNAQ